MSVSKRLSKCANENPLGDGRPLHLATLLGSRGSCIQRERQRNSELHSSEMLTRQPGLLRSGKVRSAMSVAVTDPERTDRRDSSEKPSLRRERQPEVKVGTNLKQLTSINSSSRWRAYVNC